VYVHVQKHMKIDIRCS